MHSLLVAISLLIFAILVDFLNGFIVYDLLRRLLKEFGIGKNYRSFCDPPEDGFKGKIATVVKQFTATNTFGDYEGTVTIQGVIWAARSREASVLHLVKGAEVEISSLDGITLVVKPLSDKS